MIEFIGGPWFRYGVVPLFTVGLSVYVRFASRRTEHRQWRKEYAAVGLDLMQVAVLTFLTIVASRAVGLRAANTAIGDAIRGNSSPAEIRTLQVALNQQVEAFVVAVVLLFVMVLTLWALSFIVQQWGWLNDKELRPIVGIALPLFVGLAAILVAVGVGP